MRQDSVPADCLCDSIPTCVHTSQESESHVQSDHRSAQLSPFAHCDCSTAIDRVGTVGSNSAAAAHRNPEHYSTLSYYYASYELELGLFVLRFFPPATQREGATSDPRQDGATLSIDDLPEEFY